MAEVYVFKHLSVHRRGYGIEGGVVYRGCGIEGLWHRETVVYRGCGIEEVWYREAPLYHNLPLLLQ